MKFNRSQFWSLFTFSTLFSAIFFVQLRLSKHHHHHHGRFSSIIWRSAINDIKDLYSKTKTVEWSKKIKKKKKKKKRETAMDRPPIQTPWRCACTKQALAEGIQKVKRPKGKPKTTWLGAVAGQIICFFHQNIALSDTSNKFGTG